MKRMLFTLALAAALSVTAAGAQVGKNELVRNPNRISVEDLAALPHLDAALAEALVGGRPYLSMQDFDLALGNVLSEADRKELRSLLFVPLNLNTAPREEILLVPGVGDRMAHEFEEYRPYRSLKQFRREIGKYVDKGELARLEQFVFVPVDLNTATDDAILSIPGVGKRMLHEFKEYRPYAGMEEFRREIGKYVDEDELARLERYVTLADADAGAGATPAGTDGSDE